MELASFIISIMGTVISLIGLVLTIVVMSQNRFIKKQLNRELTIQISFEAFRKEKYKYIKDLEKYSNGRFSSEDEINSIIKLLISAENILHKIDNDYSKEMLASIKSLKDGITISNQPTEVRNNVVLIADVLSKFKDETYIVR